MYPTVAQPAATAASLVMRQSSVAHALRSIVVCYGSVPVRLLVSAPMTRSRNERLTIGQLASLAGVSRSMLRYYEEQGLLRPVDRTSAGYRLYAPDAAETLLFIQRAQRLGFSLSDIRLLMAGAATGDEANETVTQIAQRRYLAIERELTELLVQRHEMGVFLKDLNARTAARDSGTSDVYQRLVQRVCGHADHDSAAGSTLAWLLDLTGCRLASMERDTLLTALQGRHVHIWRDGDSYRVLIPGHEPALQGALEAIARVEADCHTHQAPQLEKVDEGFEFSAAGEHAFLFAQFFLDLTDGNTAHR